MCRMGLWLERNMGRLLFALPGPVQVLLAGGRRTRLDGQTLDPGLQLMLHLMKIKGRGGMAGLSVEAARRDRQLDTELLPATGPKMRDVRNLTVPGAEGDLPA